MNSININYQTPNFEAKHIAKTNVLRNLTGMQKSVPMEAHLVELDLLSPTDLKTIQNIKEKWVGAEFVQMICSPYYSPDRKLYALTKQKEGFENLNPNDVLGAADVNLKGKRANLKFLQADPNIINEKSRSIKNIGRSMMLVLSEYLGKQGFDELGMFANRFVTPFYERVFPNIKHKSSTTEDFANLVVDLK
mgnify:FL=1